MKNINEILKRYHYRFKTELYNTVDSNPDYADFKPLIRKLDDILPVNFGNFSISRAQANTYFLDMGSVIRTIEMNWY